MEKKKNIPQVVIKKYANRRLYNTSTSTYVTLNDLCDMVKDGIDFGVYDAKTGEDLTHSVLTQIIMEQESKGGSNLLPVGFLRNLIGFYGGNMQLPVAKFLEESMGNFMSNQEKLQRQWNEAMGGMFPGMGAMGEMGKQNMAMIEKAMRMFTPFPGESPRGEQAGRAEAPNPQKLEAEYVRLKHQLDELQRQIQTLHQRKASDKK